MLRSTQNGTSLSHYGVKGMRWGVRKEYESRGEKSGKFGSSGKSGSSFKLSDFKDKVVDTTHGRVAVTNYNERDFRSASAFINMMDSKNPGRYADEATAKAALENLPKQTKWQSRNGQIVSNNHDAPNYARENNCFHCSIAYEMRMRGYDVQAQEKGTGWSAEAMHAFDVKDAFTIRISEPSSDKRTLAEEAYRQMEQKCLTYGDGARGVLGIQYYTVNGGHAMYWIVENGEFKIIDSQQSGRDGYETFLHAEVVDKDVDVIRLDNAEALPGVTDFVEPYEMTEEEKEKKEETAKRVEEAKTLNNQKRAEKAQAADNKMTQERDRQLLERKQAIEKKKKEAKKKSDAKKATKLKMIDDAATRERDKVLKTKTGKRISHHDDRTILWKLRK